MQSTYVQNQPMISLNQSSPASNDGQMSSVTLALRDLNKSLPLERQIKLIIFLYSKFSEKSDILIKSMPQDCRQFFYYICVDNKTIREKIINSTTMKITEVPCIIIVDINDNISTYEGNKSIEIIKTIYNLNKKHQLSKHGPNCQCPVHTKQQSQQTTTSTVTPLADILPPTSEDPYPSESKRPPRKSPIPNKLPVPIQDDEDMSSMVDDSATRMGAVRTKVRHASRPIDDGMNIQEQEPPEVGMSSVRNYPPKGVGHEGMAYSSLKQIEQQPKRNQPPMKISGGEMLDDELDDLLEDSNTSSSSKQQVDRKEAMNSVKKAAEEMKRMRENETENQ